LAFIENLIEMRNGGVVIEMEKSIEDVVAAVRATGKAGKVTLQISVKPASKGDVDTLFLQDTIKVDAPKPDKKLTLFFANEENQLSRHDTRQMNMLDGVRDISLTVEGEPKEVK
jgi:hypothetical protein